MISFKTVSNAVTSRIGRQVLLGQKHSPVVLFAVGVIGVSATVVLACRATLKLEDVLETAQENIEKAKALREADHPDYSETDYKKDMSIVYARAAGTVAKLYAPAIIIGIGSIAALTGSHFIMSRRNAALTAAYSGVHKAYKEYRKRVIEEIGEEKERELHFATQTREFTEIDADGNEVKKTEQVLNPIETEPYSVFFDERSESWSENPDYNQLFINCQQNYANDRLKSTGHLFLNELYEMLGLPKTKQGQIVGWVMGNGDNCVDFGIFKGNTNSGVRFVNGYQRSVKLVFNPDGNILDLI